MTTFWTRWCRALAVIVVCFGLTACAATNQAEDGDLPGYEQVYDPIEPVNRGIWEFNLFVDKAIVRPLASLYDLLPGGVKDGVRNVLRNMRTPVIFANNLLQGDVDGASDTFGRFLTNTIIGVGGIFDVAYGNGNGIPYRDEDFGQTLAVWGFDSGPFLMLPLLGPSNLRDTIGFVPDYFLDPINWWDMNTDSDAPFAINMTRRVLTVVDGRSRNVQQLEDLEATSLDFYATIRSLYSQTRQNQIENNAGGGMPLEPAINFDLDLEVAPSGEQASLGEAATR